MDLQVKNFYNSYFKHFDVTRVRIWKSVREFVSKMNKGARVLDIGCGNGKNIIYMNENGINGEGVDFSSNLVDICRKKGLKVKEADMRELPFEDNQFDNAICIAALHHLQNKEDRVLAIREMMRVCKDGAEILVTVWSVEQEEGCNKKHRNFKYGDNYVPWEETRRYYFIYDEEHIKGFLKQFNVKELKWERGNWYFVLKVKK